MGLFDQLKQSVQQSIQKSNDSTARRQVEAICTDYLRSFALKYDYRLRHGGSFFRNENVYEWDDEGLLIRLPSIGQDDFLENPKLFEEICDGLTKKISEVMVIRSVKCSEEEPVIRVTVVHAAEVAAK